MVGYPMVRLQVEALGETLTAAFMSHADEVGKEVSEGVNRAIASFDFASEVQKQAHPLIQKAIQSAIERYFWSEGKDVLDAAIRASLAKFSKDV